MPAPISISISPVSSTYTPVGVWTPASLSNLLMWHAADSVSGSDASVVGSWPDISGNGWTLTQSTGATIELSELNGHSVVRFDNVDDRLLTISTSAFAVGTGDYTFIGVFKTGASILATTHGYMQNGGAVPGLQTVNGRVSIRHTTDGLFTSTLGNSTWYTLILRRMSGDCNLWVNGVLDATTVTKSASWTSPAAFVYGARVSSVQPMSGDMAEGIVMKAAISDSELTNVHAYLKNKYNHYA